MSMNIAIGAVGVVTTPNGKSLPLTEFFDCWQTPTEVTNRIMALTTKEERLSAYKEYVDRDRDSESLLCTSEDNEFEWYSDEEEYDINKEHIADLDRFIKMYEGYGFTINFYSI